LTVPNMEAGQVHLRNSAGEGLIAFENMISYAS
jgi:hypothetical protein